ncbi:MAG: response regulator [Magnetococcales bacterium]|nr:response regulator [Magnetococcales bacterium]MBF0157685.1 response regulator [Magnetococcales bacterium]
MIPPPHLAPDDPESAQGDLTAGFRPRILVVDDRETNRVAMRHLLRGTAAEVSTAGSGEEALGLCLQREFALALIDVNMPGMDGFELAEYLRGAERTREIPLIFVTAALAEEIHRLRGYELGAVDFILKPVDDRILLSKVGVFLELFNAREALRRHRDELAERVRQRTASLEAAQQKLRRLDRHQNAIREEERRRIAHALHDEMGSTLANLKMTIQWLQRNRFDHERQNWELELLLGQVDETIVKVRHLTQMLRPPILDQCGLPAALEWQAAEFERVSGVAARVTTESTEVTLEEEGRIALFRILQESLTNIGRHARATEVAIALDTLGDRVRLTVADNGRGIPEELLTDFDRTMGLRGMEERACQNGGELHIESSTAGTRITAVIPSRATRP